MASVVEHTELAAVRQRCLLLECPLARRPVSTGALQRDAPPGFRGARLDLRRPGLVLAYGVDVVYALSDGHAVNDAFGGHPQCVPVAARLPGRRRQLLNGVCRVSVLPGHRLRDVFLARVLQLHASHLGIRISSTGRDVPALAPDGSHGGECVKRGSAVTGVSA